MMTYYDFLYIPLTSALFAIVWVYALTEDGALFGWWPEISNKISTDNWFIKLSYGCAKCIAGQICLWRCLISEPITIDIFWQVLIAILISLIYEKKFS